MQGIESQQPLGGRNQLLPLSFFPAQGEQLGQRTDRQGMQPPPLEFQPFLEDRITRGDALKQFSLIQPFRMFEIPETARLHQPLEGQDVDFDRGAYDLQAVRLDDQRGRACPGKHLSCRRQRLAQGIVRLWLGPVAP